MTAVGPRPTSDIRAFNDDTRYEDGLTISVSEPGELKLFPITAPSISPAQATSAVEFFITVENHSKRGYKPGSLTLVVTSAGVTADPITEGGFGWRNGPSYVLGAGGDTVKWQVAYTVKDPSHVVVTVDPEERYPVTYAN